ncbi:MAG: nitroreductase family protein [Methanomicrobiales archaeon]|nr:nitroreductase family protein [Methanomicrobiales archaeon]
MNSSEFFPFLTARASVREYRRDGVEPEDLEFLLACASTAPSAGNREAWDVIAVTDPKMKEALSRSALHQRHVAEAPLVLVVCARYDRSMSRYGERGTLYAIQDATIACTYLMLAAHARGLGSCWTGAFQEEGVRELLNIPAPVRPVALLTVGKGTLPLSRTGRMPVGDHLHRETW